jgi:hypothetical protein
MHSFDAVNQKLLTSIFFMIKSFRPALDQNMLASILGDAWVNGRLVQQPPSRGDCHNT